MEENVVFMHIYTQDTMSIDDIVAELKAGKTVVYPTETCYGLGCDATQTEAVQRIFSIKQRQKSKTVLVLMPHQEMAREYVQWNDTLERLAERYWPGPLTVVAPALPDVVLPEGILAEDGTIAFRISAHPLAKALCDALGAPLVSTSANIASMDSPYDISEVEAMFGQQEYQPDIVIDGGTLPDKSPSTIVRIEGGGVQVLRQGEVVVQL